MKHIIAVLLLLASLTCTAQYYHEVTEKVHPVEDLRADVDLVSTTLKKGDPNIYAYITERELDRKFDSLKTSLTPMTSQVLSAKLLPILSAIGDGHILLTTDQGGFTTIENAHVRHSKTGPVYLLAYLLIGNHIYIDNNSSPDISIQLGTEVLSIDHQPAAEIIAALLKHVPSDGYNTTFKYYLLNLGSFADNYYAITAYRDSSVFELKYKNEVRAVTLHSFFSDTLQKRQVAPSVQQPSVELSYFPKINNTPYLKLNSFNDAYRITGSYDKMFSYLKRIKAKTLVLDLRGNTGGVTELGASFFSYLIDTPSFFHKPVYPEPRKDTVLSKRNLNEFRALRYGAFAAAHVKPKPNAFKGKLYVLINGGTFSTGAMLASALKRNNIGKFIGTETGGSANLWSGATKFKTVDLPGSKLVLRYADKTFRADKESKPFGHGIMPDVPMIYTIEDYVANKDLEMEWVMKDIGKGSK